jgi:hypothetical protein
MPRVLMNFQLHNDWVVHFIEADCRTTIGSRTRYFHFRDEAEFRAFVGPCNLKVTLNAYRSKKLISTQAEIAEKIEEETLKF